MPSDKLSARAVRGFFVGNSSTQKGYHCYEPTFKPTFITKDALFDENTFFFPTISSSTTDSFHSLPTQDESATRRMEDSLPPQYPPFHLSEAPIPDQRTLDQEGETSAPHPTSFTYFPKYYIRRKTILVTNHSSTETNSAKPVDHNLSENSRQEDLPLALRKPSRTSVKPRPYAISSFLTFARASPAYRNFLITLNQISIPKIVDEALKSIHWCNVVQLEM